MKHVLRFACGAVSPPFEGSFEGWVRENIKAMKGYALGHRRQDGRHRVTVWDLDRETITPTLPDGTPAHCLTCPCPKEAGRREIEGKPKRSSPFRQLMVLCYPEEVSVDTLVEAAIDDATRKVASDYPVINDRQICKCFIHGDFEGFECPKCAVRNDQESQK